MRLEGKIALVTGAAQGLGEALAERLAKEGCSVALADINGERVRATAERIAKETGRETLAVTMDVSDESSVAAGFCHVEDQFSKLDILVANAGILKAHRVIDFPVEEWRSVIEVNLVGYFLCAREASRLMSTRGSGVIIHINSKSGKKGSFGNSAYAASKFGGIGLTQSLALEMAPFGVRVNSVCPGNLLDGTLWQESLYEQYAATQNLTVEQVRAKYLDQVPLGRGCSYEDVANVVAFLASDEAGYMTGQAINVTGGQEMR
jgi:sorbitol-6-phosphate 2-dehydrogenase